MFLVGLFIVMSACGAIYIFAYADDIAKAMGNAFMSPQERQRREATTYRNRRNKRVNQHVSSYYNF